MVSRPEDLMNAASEGRLDLIKNMLATGNININLLDWRGCALPAAIINGHTDVARYLLQRGANTGVAINVASSIGSVEMVQTLLNHGASVGDKDYDAKTPLHLACENGHLEVVKVLLATGARVSAMDISERTPLHLASRSGKLKVVETLISNHANVYTKDRGGNTSLHRACEGGNAAVVQKLLNHRANVHAVNNLDQIPLHRACEVGNTEVVKVLMVHGKYSQDELNEALNRATEEGFHEIVEILLLNGARVSNSGKPLYSACLNDRLKVVQVLLAHGANVHEMAPDGSTPLHMACATSNLEILELLLNYGASVTIKDDDGRIPMHYARSNNMVRALLKHDIDVNMADARGNTTLVYGYDLGLCCTLLDCGAGAGLKCRKLGCLREKTGMMCFYMFCRNSVRCNCPIDKQLCLDSISHKNLIFVDAFERYFIKVKTAKLSINENEKSHDPPLDVDWSNDKRNAYTAICELELEKMKTQVIRNTKATYFDLLTRNIIDLQNEAILGNFNLNKCLDNFPIYGDMIYKSYLNFRKAFLKEHSITFFGLTEPWLPIECAERIISYLSNQDMDNLLEVCHT